MTYELLETITGPEDLARLDLAQLMELAAQIRQQLVEIITSTGGHLGTD